MFTEDDVAMILDSVNRHTGMVFEPEKRYLVENRMQRMLKERRMEPGALMQSLRAGDGATIAQVADAMAIQETYFFRDPWLFDSLREDVIPALVARRSRERTLRLWSAACATGQEVWSVALLMQQIPELQGWNIEIMGSDFSRTALERARQGRYSHMEVNRGLPARDLAMHFQRVGLEWEVGSALRRQVSFREINLVESWPELPTFDIVLLRNVLIYFDTATRRDVLRRVRRHMADDGFLFLGGSESPLGVVDDFLPSVSNRACYYYVREEE